jgi:hypothetical protein
MKLKNSTHLETGRIRRLFERHTDCWPRFSRLETLVRYSRSAEFSGSCFYNNHLITVNLGRTLSYPYGMRTSIARAQSNATHWWKPIYTIWLEDGYQLVLFVFLHEFYHYLVKRAGRNPRRKESMCDRFAARALVDVHGLPVTDPNGALVGRDCWDFQDLDRFVEGVWNGRSKNPPVQTASQDTFSQLMLFNT